MNLFCIGFAWCHVHLISSQIWPFQVPPVLTRRDQLKLKEEKERARKEKSVAKENAKDDQKGEVVKKRRGRKAKASEPEMEEPEQVSATAPKARAKRKPRAKKLSKLDENAAEGDESVKPIAEPEAVEPALGDTHDVPEKTRKGGAKAKAKAKSEQKKEPKKKAKAKAKSRGHQDENAESGNEQDEENMKTPKKMLFQSDDEDGDEKCKAGDCKEDRIADAKTGEVKKLSEIYNADAPKQWEKSKPQKRLKSASAASTLPASSSAASCPDQDDSHGPKKPAAKRASRKKDAELSPFAKNESKRRKKSASKDETRIMQGGPEACPQVQGICIQHMKAVQGLTYDEMKDYLADSIEKDFFNFKLDPYKTRSACGLQTHLVRKDKKTEIAYFGRSGTAPGWNESMVLSYVSCSLLVSWLGFQL